MRQEMQAAMIRRYGTADTIKIERVAAPEPKANEIRVAVRASDATAAGAMMRAGVPRFARLFLGLRGPKHPIPGAGFAGVVDRVGTKVTSFRVGDPVFGEAGVKFGANAEFVCVAEDAMVLPKPDALSFEEAAVSCDGPLTSYNFLVALGEVSAGQNVLVIGAAGALGSAAVQIAKARGAHVTGVASAHNAAFLRTLGADATIDYRLEDYTRSGRYDVIYDAVGKSTFAACRPVLSETGRYLSPVLSIGLLFAMLRTRRATGKRAIFSATGLLPEEQLRQMMQSVLQMIARGQLVVPITARYPLARLAEAHEVIDGGHKRGNLVIAG